MYTNAVILGGILLFGFVGERYIWNMWGPEFQDMARILGSLVLLMAGIACTYSAANVFAKRKTEDLIRAEERITHLNAVLRAIRNVNQLITREKNRDRLLQSACDNLIETRGYHSVWVALLDEAGGLVTAAEARLGGDFLPMVERLKRGELTACGRRALSQPGIVVTEDPLSVCTDCPLSVNCGGRGAMTVRLEHEGKVYGLSSVSIPTDFTADEEERSLFEEVTGDIAFALHNIKLDEERKRAEEALKEYSERLEEMVEERTQELQDAQEQLVRREKLAILGQLAGGVGHELRNPLGVISNAVYFLQMTLAETDETTREYLDIVSSEVRDAEKIVSDLLDFSRTRMPEREEIAASALVSQVLERRPPPENVEVTTEIPSDLPPVFVDPRQIGQVLGNLVTNAYQAMPDGGRLMISVSEDQVMGRHEDTVTGRPGDDLPVIPSPCLRVSISDTGCGISEENMGKIFEPLFTTKAKGIGLGLAVSRNLVEGNGGSIKVESEMGKGSTFTVRLGTGD
jgi:signal transduction histidine kinase